MCVSCELQIVKDLVDQTRLLASACIIYMCQYVLPYECMYFFSLLYATNTFTWIHLDTAYLSQINAALLHEIAVYSWSFVVLESNP